MANLAACKFKFCILGDGRSETIVKQPLSPNPSTTVVTGGNVSYQSPVMMTKVVLQPGWNQIIDPATYITNMTRNYFDFIPPTGSTFMKVLAGATTDVGVSLVPNLPMRYAFPAGPIPLYLYSQGATAEACDLWIY